MEVDAKDLKAAVRRLDAIYKGQDNRMLPVLRQVRIFAYESRLGFFATDLDARLGLTVHAVGSAEFDLLIAFADLKASVGQLSGRLEIGVREPGDFFMGPFNMRPTYQLDEYPLLQGTNFGESYTLVAEAEEPGFSQALRGVLPAACEDKARPQLAGVLWDVKNEVFVATDGHRLHLAPARITMTEIGKEMPDAIFPMSGVQTLLTCSGKDTVRICRTPTHQVRFEGKDFTLVLREIDQGYPSWQQVVPLLPATLKVPRRMLHEAAKKATKIDFERQGCAFLTESGQYLDFVMLRQQDQPVTCGMKLPAIDGNLPEGECFTMNPRYIADAIDKMNGELVAIHYNDSLEPIMFRDTGPSDILSVVMPMKTGGVGWRINETGGAEPVTQVAGEKEQ